VKDATYIITNQSKSWGNQYVRIIHLSHQPTSFENSQLDTAIGMHSFIYLDSGLGVDGYFSMEFRGFGTIAG
jgi:hypothetical protein